MRRRPHALHLTIAAAVAFAAAGTVVAVSPATAAGERKSYVVQLTEAPLASYRGGLAGLPATNPATAGTSRLDVTSAASRAYLGHLSVRHAAVEKALEAAVGRDITRAHDYRYAYNGFAASLTAAEAKRLQSLPGVLRVQPAVLRQLLTDAGPGWIGAPTVWNGANTPGGAPNEGEGVVVGVIDTGVNSDHPSFAAEGGDGYVHTNPRKNLLGGKAFYGLCDPVLGRPFCNDKLIGVYDFTGTSPEDDNQHGSHTASTAVGNHVLEAALKAPTKTIKSRISGVAPHANLITYKACTVPGCLSPSTVAAIDQATADGVDVINYSIGGGSTDPWTDPDAQAFLGARDAGVFVAASAGNSGPAASTVGSPSDAPWVTSVAASTHNRSFVNSLATSGDNPPGTLTGGGFTSGYGPFPVVDAKNFGDELCATPFLPGTFTGQIVLCKRGVNPRVEKGTNVKMGGAGGMVLLNTAAEGESTVADAHVLPAVHLGFSAAEKVVKWVNGGNEPMGTISGATASTAPANGDVMAGFSSRGPNKSVPGVIKPDISAPGVDILAAVHTTDPTAGPEFGLLSGTSMSGPHLAGGAALVRAVHPEWSVAQVQSAIMTTATDSMRKEDGTTPSDPFDRGAGRVDLTRAALAGLTLETGGPGIDGATFNAANPDPAVGGNPSALNLPSMASSSCAATCTWVRTVTNVLPTTATWDISSVVPAGMKLTAKPSRVTLAPGQSVPITVTADVTGLRAGTWRFAKLTMVERAGQAPGVHLPVAVLPGGAPVPVNLVSTGPSGTATQTLIAPARINGLTTNVLGLAKGLAKTLQVSQDPTPLDPYDSPEEGVGSRTEVVSVAEGARVLAAEIASTTANDLDLFVGLDANGDGKAVATEEVCRSASETALESCLLANPKPGQYWVVVQNFLTGQVVDDAELVVANVPGTNAGNLTATGPSGVVAAGKPYDVTLTWKDLGMAAGTTWFGLVELGLDKKALPGSAGSLLVRIDRD